MDDMSGGGDGSTEPTGAVEHPVPPEPNELAAPTIGAVSTDPAFADELFPATAARNDVFSDVTPPHGTPLDDTALDDTALDDSALHDTALHDTALHETVHPDGSAHADDHATTEDEPDLYVLPAAPAKPPPEAAMHGTQRGAATWYRTEQDRYKSVRRRANPWYRRLARGVIGVAFLAAGAVGVYFGARAVQDLLDRDRLPAAGVEVPTIRSTSFEIRSTAPAPILDGTLTLDTTSRAFEFVGRGSSPQAGIQVLSEDGSTVLIRRGDSEFSAPGAADQAATDVQLAVSYLVDDVTADAILTNRLRRGFVTLDDRTEVGAGDDQRIRYEVRIDTASFARDYPLQAQEFRDGAIPGVGAVRSLPVTLTLDADGVLTGVDDQDTNWSWQRLAYSDQPFVPNGQDPGLDAPITITDGNIGDDG